MKALYFLDIKPSHIGSLDFFLCDLAKEMDGQLVVAFSSEPLEPLKQFYQEKGLQYLVVKKKFWPILKLCFQYNKVMTGFFRLNSLIVALLALCNIPYIYVQHNSFFDYQLIDNQPLFKKYIEKIKLRLTFTLVSKVVCVSQFILNELVKSGIASNKLICIYNGVNVKEQANYDAKELNLAPIDLIKTGKNQIKCIFIGSLEWFKGVDIVLEVAPLVPHVDFFLAGDGAFKEKVLQATQTSSNVYYLGVVQNFIVIAKYFNFAIVPSRWNESFCYTAVEALYSNLPVIASKKGALPEVLQLELAVFLDAIDVYALQKAISQVLVKTHKPIENTNHFSIENMTRAYANLLRS